MIFFAALLANKRT